MKYGFHWIFRQDAKVLNNRYRWESVGTGGYWWVLVDTGGYWRVPMGTGGCWLSLSITLLQTQIVTNYDCHKLRLLQTQIVTNLDRYKLTDFQFTENSWPKNANWEEVLYEDSVKDLLKIC